MTCTGDVNPSCQASLLGVGGPKTSYKLVLLYNWPSWCMWAGDAGLAVLGFVSTVIKA